jgi:hypothetical protein
MSEPMTAPAVPEESPEDSFLSRAINIFISPAQAFESIVRRPDFIAPLIVCIVAAIGVSETMLHKIGMERIVRQSIEMSSQASRMSPEQIQQAVQRGAGIGSIIARVGELLGAPIFLLLIAALGLFIVNVMFGAKTSFKVDFSVVCYAYLVGLVGGVLALAIVLFGDAEQFNPQNFIPSNIGFFLNPREVSKPLYSLASSFDVFTVWFLIVASVGLSTATHKKVRTLPIFASFAGLWVLWALIKAGLAMLMS